MRVLAIFGTRPEAIKMAPVVAALTAAPGIEAQVCVTGQHRQMLDSVLDLFAITPDVDLDLMRPNQTLGESTAAVLTQLDPVLTRLQPDWVLVLGDTTTVIGAALAAYYRHIRVGHIEAGLRTGDKYQPFPEEINRRLATALADLHLAPTEGARQNLLHERVDPARIVVTGNPVIDALQQIAARPEPAEVAALIQQLGVGPGGRRLVLATAHRRENFGAPLVEICHGLRQLAAAYPDDVRIVYPVHLNPQVQEPVYRLLGDVPQITLLPPLDYLPWVHLMKHAYLLLTDSGGLQEEAPSLGVPVLVLRDKTERPEGIAAGTVRLIPVTRDGLWAAARELLDDPAAHAAMANAVNPYGDGHAAARIVAALLADERAAGERSGR
jgi:UDP-N-acetylglucosamine 2-epimerase (non-hydrolysing)